MGRYNRKNYRQRRDLFLSNLNKAFCTDELLNEFLRRKRLLATKWVKDIRRGTLPRPLSLVLSEFYSQKNNSSK